MIKVNPRLMAGAFYSKILGSVAVLIVLCGGALAQRPEPVVSPDRLADVPLASNPDFKSFYDYSWRNFIALNWPARSGGAGRGLPDRRRAFGDADGPRVWMTWKSRYEIFQPGGTLPSPWASYEGKNPCGEGFTNDAMTLSSFGAFADFNQAGFGYNLANPLVAQNHAYVRYEVRVNQAEFDSIVGNKWYIHANLPTSATPVPFNTGSTVVKAAWRILNQNDTPAIRSRYYVVRAQVFDVFFQECNLQDVALVGFHIVTKTRDRPQWIWSTFEHVDNVKPSTNEPRSPTRLYSFNNPNLPQTLVPATPPPPISPANRPEPDPSPMQVIRTLQIEEQARDINLTYWNLPEIKGTVWQNYMLVMAQWPSKVAPESPTHNGDPTPKVGSAMSNTTMETYFQKNMSCMGCHDSSNQQGRDFAMFVSLDAYRPGVLAPGDLFSAKLSEPPDAAGALSSDPMLKSLMQFLEGAGQK